MDKERIELVVLGLFGACGLVLFIVLLFFFESCYKAEYQGRLQGACRAVTSGAEQLLPVVVSSTGSAFGMSALGGLGLPRSWSVGERVVPSIPRLFTVEEIETATCGFSPANLVACGHTGAIYAATLADGVSAMVKVMGDPAKPSGACNVEYQSYFLAEMEIYGRILDQQYLVPLLGHCHSPGADAAMPAASIMVYGRMANGDLASALASPAHARADMASPSSSSSSSSSTSSARQALTWAARLSIARGLAQALLYLHHHCKPPWAHRSIQSGSVMLTEKNEVRLGSLGDSVRVDPTSHLATYDIFCFGKVLLDLLSARNISAHAPGDAGEAWMATALALLQQHEHEHEHEHDHDRDHDHEHDHIHEHNHEHEHAYSPDFLQMLDPFLVLHGPAQEQEAIGLALIAKACLDPITLGQLSMPRVVKLLEDPQDMLTLHKKTHSI